MKKIIIKIIEKDDCCHNIISILNHYDDDVYDDIVAALQLLSNANVIKDWSFNILES